MQIQVKKFGTTLSSREAGKEALLAFQPSLKDLSNEEPIEVDFAEVVVMGPSWADEFITPLIERYQNRITIKNVENPSIQVTLDFLKNLPQTP